MIVISVCYCIYLKFCVYNAAMKLKATQIPDKEIFRNIFIDHWDQFKEEHPRYDKPQYEEPVQKMLGCGKESNGYSEYICMYCGRDRRRIGFSCKSCFCLSCAKKYVDDFVSQVSSMCATRGCINICYA